MPAQRLTKWAAAAILAGTGGLALLRVALPASAANPAPPRLAVPPLPVDARTTLPPRARPAAPPQPIVVRRVLDTGGPLRYGTWFWEDGAAPAGPITIAVDLKAATLSVFRGGDEIGTTAVIYGNDGKETPLGTFPIMAKDRHHVSKRYHAPMPYMLRLTGDGVSIHASEVAADYATHGCVGVPAGFAARLFAVAKVGDRVIITRRGLATAAAHAPTKDAA